MFSKPLFVPVATVLILAPILCLILVSLDGWWATPFPEAFASYHVEHSRHLYRHRMCNWGIIDDWKLFAAAADGEAWFQGAFERSVTPEARLTAVLGLYALKSPPAPTLLSDARRLDGLKRLLILEGDSSAPMAWDSAATLVANGSLTAVYSDTLWWPEC